MSQKWPTQPPADRGQLTGGMTGQNWPTEPPASVGTEFSRSGGRSRDRSDYGLAELLLAQSF